MSIALQAREGMLDAAKSVPDKLREVIEGEEWQGWWLAAFRARLQRGERDAVRLYPELLRMVGANDAALEVALRALGVSLDAARIAVGAYQQVQGMDAEQAADFSLARLQEHYAAQGKRLVLLDGIEPGGAGELTGAAPVPCDDPRLNGAKDGANGSAA